MNKEANTFHDWAFTFERLPDTHRRTSDGPVIILLGLMVGKAAEQ
jgi:hypothetical protein